MHFLSRLVLCVLTLVLRGSRPHAGQGPWLWRGQFGFGLNILGTLESIALIQGTFIKNSLSLSPYLS